MTGPAPEPGILHPGQARRHYRFRKHPPGELGEWVENFWTVSWDLAAGERYVAQVLPYPSVNLTVTDTECEVTGLVRRRYDRRLQGSGFAVGARFRPGCFRPWVDFPVSVLTDRHRPAAEVLGRPTSGLAERVRAESAPGRRVRILTDFLVGVRPERDPTAGELARLVELVRVRPDLTRVPDLATLAGCSVRTLQRLFADYVGAGPKWVIQRCRLQDAALRAAGAEPVDWAALAADLGFSDQAHLTRVFSATVGVPPARYAREAGGVSVAVRTSVR